MQNLLEALAGPTWEAVRCGLEPLLRQDDPGLWEVLAEGCWVWPDGEIEVSGRSRIHRLQGDPGLRRAIALYALCRSGRMRRSTCLDLRGCGPEAIREVLPWLPAVEEITWDLNDAPADLSVLAGLERLRALKLAGCGALKDLDGLAGLPALSTLRLAGCGALRHLGGLGGLPALSSIWLEGCGALRHLGGLAGLGRLSALRLEGCGALVSAEAVAGLAGLRSLRLSGGDALESLALPVGGGLERVSAEDCGALRRVAGADLPGLEELMLRGCGRLREIRVERAPRLGSLHINGCDPELALAGVLRIVGSVRAFGVDWPVLARAPELLRGLPNLEWLSVSGGEAMQDTGWLAGLASLRGLRLEECGAADFSGIGGLARLYSLWLAGCHRLEHLDALRGLAELREVVIEDCPALTDIGGLGGDREPFYRVALRSCAALADLGPLEGNEVVSLEVIGCPSVAGIAPPDILARC